MLLVDEVIYVNAGAWKSSTYKGSWPYNSRLDSSYFEAIVTKQRDNKTFLTFSAFELDHGMNSYSTSWLNRYATRELPPNGTIITKEMYEAKEVGPEDNSIPGINTGLQTLDDGNDLEYNLER